MQRLAAGGADVGFRHRIGLREVIHIIGALPCRGVSQLIKLTYDALFHLVGGLVGEGDGKDMLHRVGKFGHCAQAPRGAIAACHGDEHLYESLGQCEGLA